MTTETALSDIRTTADELDECEQMLATLTKEQASIRERCEGIKQARADLSEQLVDLQAERRTALEAGQATTDFRQRRRALDQELQDLRIDLEELTAVADGREARIFAASVRVNQAKQAILEGKASKLTGRLGKQLQALRDTIADLDELKMQHARYYNEIIRRPDGTVTSAKGNSGLVSFDSLRTWHNLSSALEEFELP